MKVTPTSLPEVLLIEPKVFGDERGFFFESFNERAFDEAVGRKVTFVQDNHSRSTKGVLRGLHYQVEQTQGKLVRVVRGAVFDIAIDLRRSSPRFGQWTGVALSESDHRQLWIPEGFGHGFLVTSDSADFLYKTTDYWSPKAERCIVWNDPTLAIEWPLDGRTPAVSVKDDAGSSFDEAEVFACARRPSQTRGGTSRTGSLAWTRRPPMRPEPQHPSDKMRVGRRYGARTSRRSPEDQ